MSHADSGYRPLLRTPGAAAFFLAAAVGRTGIAMTGIGLVWLLHARTGRKPDLVFGNSTLDIPLLLAASLPVAVGLLPGPPSQPNPFLAQAAQRGWARLEIPAA